MPCDYRILQSPTKEQVLLVLLETVQRSQYDNFDPRSLGCLCEQVDIYM